MKRPRPPPVRSITYGQGVTTSSALPLTGERTAPGIERENYWFRRHEAAYQWVGKRWLHKLRGTVVDAGCGEGYGSALLARATDQRVIGLELDSLAAGHAQRVYSPALEVIRANLDALPLVTNSVDALVSMQVIEHLWDVPGFLDECQRVLKPGGLFILSTPNRLTFSPGLARGQKPANPFHVEEFDASQLVDLVAASWLGDAAVWGLRHAGKLPGWEAKHGDMVAAQVRAVLSEDPEGAWTDELLAGVRAVTAKDFAITRDGVDDSSDLIVVATQLAGFA